MFSKNPKIIREIEFNQVLNSSNSNWFCKLVHGVLIFIDGLVRLDISLKLLGRSHPERK